MERLDGRLLENMLGKEKSPSEWTEEFGLILGSGTDGVIDANDMQMLQAEANLLFFIL